VLLQYSVAVKLDRESIVFGGCRAVLYCTTSRASRLPFFPFTDYTALSYCCDSCNSCLHAGGAARCGYAACPAAETAPTVEEYAANNKRFISDLAVVFAKMLTKGYEQCALDVVPSAGFGAEVEAAAVRTRRSAAHAPQRAGLCAAWRHHPRVAKPRRGESGRAAGRSVLLQRPEPRSR
jgi:hypothetical protein